MDIPRDIDELTSLFERFGAREPALLARSQIEEGIPQLQRFLFLRQVWRNVVCENDTNWMRAEIQGAQKRADAPYASVGLALRRCLDNGASARDLNDIVRGMQAKFLFAVCDLLDDSIFSDNELGELGLGLFEVDGDGKPVLALGGLHESMLETDPTGREMRPRKEAD